ncbi:hypothetical protein SCA6_004208 [Theobroma cacao]
MKIAALKFALKLEIPKECVHIVACHWKSERVALYQYPLDSDFKYIMQSMAYGSSVRITCIADIPSYFTFRVSVFEGKQVASLVMWRNVY